MSDESQSQGQSQDDAQESGAEKFEETRSEERGTADVGDEPTAGPVLNDESATAGTANQTPDGEHPGTDQMQESDIGSDSPE